MSIPLAALESITDASGIALRIEVLLPIGVRHRQLRVRTLILGMLLTLASRRPAFLTEVHEALTALPADDLPRLGVTEQWKHGPHLLTYRQVERTFSLVVKALSKDEPDGAPSGDLASVLDDLLEASIPAEHKDASTALAADWTDVETFSRPAPPWQHRVRGPRGILGPPHQQPARPQGRDVLRLLPVRRHHDPRGSRPAGPGAGPPDDPHQLPPGPGPRPGPRLDPHGRRRRPPRRHPGRLRLRPPPPGPSRSAGPAPS